jgi:hypothetical protein
MHKLLVPIEYFSGLSLSATYFAIEFAKRNPAKIFFLIFSKGSKGGTESISLEDREDLRRKQFEALLQRARSQKINLEIFYSSEDFYEVTSQFCKDHGLTEIILALPSERDPAYALLLARTVPLRNNLESQLIIVRPKEEKDMTAEKWQAEGELSPAWKSKTPSGKKGS